MHGALLLWVRIFDRHGASMALDPEAGRKESLDLSKGRTSENTGAGCSFGPKGCRSDNLGPTRGDLQHGLHLERPVCTPIPH